MATASIVIDDREHALEQYWAKYSKDYGISYTIRRIQTGDIAVVYQGKVVISIERKTWKDLAASFRDGRLLNVEKMMQLRDEMKCCLYYLIEGPPCPKPNTKFGRIPMKSLRSHLDHLELRDNIHILYSTSPEYSVERIMSLATSYVSLVRKQEMLKKKHAKKAGASVKTDVKTKVKTDVKTDFLDVEPIEASCDSSDTSSDDSDDSEVESEAGSNDESDDETSDEESSKVTEIFDLEHFKQTPSVPESLTTVRKTSSDLQKTMLMCLDKIGLTRAELLLECGLTIRDFRDGISEQTFVDIAKAHGISTQVAQRNAEVICKCRLKRRVLINVLSCINGITKPTAEIILDKVSFADISMHKLDALESVTIHGKKIKAIIQKIKDAFPLT